MINVGVVGLGHVASHHIAAIEESRSFRLVAACDPNPDALRFSSPAVRAVSDIDALLAFPDVDAVIVASPNRFHVEHGIKVIEAGKWLVMEKPVAPTRDEFERLAEARALKGARCSVALHAAFGVEVDWFCQQREQGALDDFVISSLGAQFYDPYFTNGELERRALSLSGSWMDSGINALSVVDRVLGAEKLALVDSRMTRVAAVPCTEVQGTVDFEYRTGETIGTGWIDTNWTLGRNKKVTTLTAIGPWRRVVLDHSEQRVVLREGHGQRELFRCDNGKPRLTNHYIGVFRDLADQMARESDNFESCKVMHDHLYAAAEWRTRAD
jgi:D-galactose 1-dehydrogenase